MQPDPTDRQPTEVPEPATLPEALDHLTRARQQLAHSNSELDKARKEAAGYRTGNKGALAAAARRISAVLGSPVADDQDAPDINSLLDQLEPSKHAAALKSKDDTIRGLKLRATLSENFQSLGLKPGLARAALIDQGHMEKLSAAVDATDFDEQVSTVLEELAELMPEVKGSGTAPTRTSAPFRPNVGHDTQLTQEELAALTPEQVTEALRTGKLDRMLGRR
jgi:hypothetical protein